MYSLPLQLKICGYTSQAEFLLPRRSKAAWQHVVLNEAEDRG